MKRFKTLDTDIGQLFVVNYHGSITSAHGEWLRLWECDCDECRSAFDVWEFGGQFGPSPTRWVLSRRNGERLEHVRPSSFDYIEEPEPAQA